MFRLRSLEVRGISKTVFSGLSYSTLFNYSIMPVARLCCIGIRGAFSYCPDLYCSATMRDLLRWQALGEPAILVSHSKMFIRDSNEPNANAQNVCQVILLGRNSYENKFKIIQDNF